MIKAVCSALLKYKNYIEENRIIQAKEKENSVMVLDQEISGLKEKKKVLNEVCKTIRNLLHSPRNLTDGYVTNETPFY